MNSITKTIRGLQRFLSTAQSPFARISPAELASRVATDDPLPKAFSPLPKPLPKGTRRKKVDR